MYEQASSKSYSGLGQFWGEQSKSNFVDPNTVIPKAPSILTASGAGQLLYNAKALRHFEQQTKKRIKDDVFWMSSGPVWSQKAVKNAGKAEVVEAPKQVKTIQTKIVRDMPTLNLPPVGLSGFDGLTFSLAIPLVLILITAVICYS